MNQKIREYIDELFEGAPKTRAAVDMKEEIISNAEEKMSDLLAQGYREEDAFGVVIHSIGNVEELFEELRNEAGDKNIAVQDEKIRKKKAVTTAAAVGLYILAGVVFLLFGVLEDMLRVDDLATIGLILGAVLCIPPTCMLIYSAIMYPTYRKNEDNMVEEYKEWKSGASRNKEVRGAISTIIWTLGVAGYFFISFESGDWRYTWIIFLILACVDSIVSLIFSLKK